MERSSGGDELWTVEQTMAHLDLGRSSVYGLLAQGELTRVKVMTRTRVLADSVRAYLARAVSAATPPHGLPLGGQVWPPGTIGALEAGDGPLAAPQGPGDLEGRG